MIKPSKNVGVCGYGKDELGWLERIRKIPEIWNLWIADDVEWAAKFMQTDRPHILLVRPNWEGEPRIEIPETTVVIHHADPTNQLLNELGYA